MAQTFDFPEVCVSEISWYLEENNRAFNNPLTGGSQIGDAGSSKWVGKLTLNNKDLATARILDVFFLKLRGRYNKFRIYDPLFPEPLGIAAGSPVVDVSHQKGRVLVIRGTPPLQNFLKAGDYFNVGESLHRLTEDADTDANGKTILRFEPPIRNSPAVNTPIKTSKCTVRCHMRDPKQAARATRAPILSSYTIDFEEAIYD